LYTIADRRQKVKLVKYDKLTDKIAKCRIKQNKQQINISLLLTIIKICNCSKLRPSIALCVLSLLKR